MGRIGSAEITSFILNEVDVHPTTLVARAAKSFGISRQAVLKRIKRLVESGDLQASGTTKGRTYALRRNEVLRVELQVAGLEEDNVYRDQILPVLGSIPDNIQRICNYGFTEILNNAIDHSSSPTVVIDVSRTSSVVELVVHDVGIGIFKKIMDALGLKDRRHALIELSKGKLTTDAAHHSGQGIFFTSRLFDHFSILSENLHFWHRQRYDDWLREDHAAWVPGTFVQMRICVQSTTNIKDMFDKFSTPEDEYGFARTHVPISLAQFGDDDLVSRSQAKRVLARFEQFQEVLLDFAHVDSIGQAFADEIFRVFRRNNPVIRVHWINANPEVTAMIQRAIDDFVRESGASG